MGARLGAKPGLAVGGGRVREPRPSPHPFTSFCPATSLTTRPDSACQGTMKACGTGNLGDPGDWRMDGRCRGDPPPPPLTHAL